MVIKVPRNKIQKIDIVNITGGMTADNIYKKYKPDYMVNLALYDMATGLNITYMEDENIQTGYLFSNEGIGIEFDQDVKWCTHDEATSSIAIKDYISGSPTLVKEGNKYIDWGNMHNEYLNGTHMRSAIGFNNEEVILYSSDNKMTLNSLSEALILQNCRYAINIDGGGSCHLQAGSKVYKRSYRKNASWLLIYLVKEWSDYTVTSFTNNSSKSLPVYETTACIKKIGSLDPNEVCSCLYEDTTFRVVLYNITGKTERKVGFVKK